MWKFSLDLESIMYRRYRQTNKILQPHFIGTLKKVKHCRKHTGADSLQPIWRFLVREKKGKVILYGQSDLKGFSSTWRKVL